MPLTTNSLLAPKGRVELAMFPAETVAQIEERLDEYLKEGYIKAPGNDGAAAAWSYYRAFDAAYIRQIALPSTVDIEGEGRQSYLLSQANALKEARDKALAEFTAITEPEPLPKTAYSPTTHVNCEYVW